MVLNYLNRKKTLLHFLSVNQELLVSGTYHTKRNVAFLSESELAKRFIGNFYDENGNGLKDTIKNIIDKKYRFNSTSEKNSFKGTVLLLTWSENLKIFDLAEKKLLTKSHSIEEYLHYKETYQSVSPSFPLPKVYSFDDSKLSYVEEMIDFVAFRLWDEQLVRQALSTCFTQYCGFYQDSEGRMTKVSDHLDEKLLKTNWFTSRLLEDVSQDQSFRVVKTHGDLWFDNLLYDGNQFYFVDWEYYGEYFFFSDLLNVFFAEALMRNDYTYLQRFLTGEFDDEFRRLFLAAGCDDLFEDNFRREILFLYVLERFCKKDGRKTEEEKQEMLKGYEGIFQKLGL